MILNMASEERKDWELTNLHYGISGRIYPKEKLLKFMRKFF